MTDVGDHYRSEADDGVYRVVGMTEGIALLRVTDADGRRAHTGDLRRVSRDELETGFEAAGDPDAGISPLGAIRDLLQGMYWDVRKFL